MANSDAAAGKDITLRATSTNPGKASWTGFVSGDSGEEPITGSWSKALPGAGANLYILNRPGDDGGIEVRERMMAPCLHHGSIQ